MNKFDQFPLVGEYDVVVVGGGTAGFAAAAAAAGQGLKTLLLEEKAYLGGTATGAQIGQLMGFAEGEACQPQKGILGQVLNGLRQEGGTSGIESIYLCGRKDLEIQVVPYISEYPRFPKYLKPASPQSCSAKVRRAAFLALRMR